MNHSAWRTCAPSAGATHTMSCPTQALAPPLPPRGLMGCRAERNANPLLPGPAYGPRKHPSLPSPRPPATCDAPRAAC
jgi:hypothetical protein